MPEKEARRRIFFALWPDAETRRALVRATRSVVRRSGGRATPPDNLHVTLAFLGPVTEVLLERVRRVPPLVSPHFELIFDRLGFWRGSRLRFSALCALRFVKYPQSCGRQIFK